MSTSGDVRSSKNDKKQQQQKNEKKNDLPDLSQLQFRLRPLAIFPFPGLHS